MQIYLPIAEMSVDVFLLLALGGGVGVLSGLFGVGGGFLLTPLLLFIGVPAAVAVASQANQVVAASVSGALAQWRRNAVDPKLAWVMIGGGLVGAWIGVLLFNALKDAGQIDIAIALSYVLLLGVVGGLMLFESLRSWLFPRRRTRTSQARRHSPLLAALPLKLRFRKSRLYLSAIAPAFIGMIVGALAALLGIGGGFLLVPAMIYLLGVPTAVSIGSSLFQVACVSAVVAFLHAVETQSVDVVLAAILLIGSTLGAQVGARLAGKMRGEQLRALLAIVILAVATQLAIDLATPPIDPFDFVAAE
ncbi:MAG: sulfite exporter TauE/SafE family protein [Pseudomonadota bacterium]